MTEKILHIQITKKVADKAEADLIVSTIRDKVTADAKTNTVQIQSSYQEIDDQ